MDPKAVVRLLIVTYAGSCVDMGGGGEDVDAVMLLVAGHH
jgi:hypothetical protein